jgi:type VI secretion system protein ImpH
MNYLGFEYAWDLQVLVRRGRTLGARLGQFGHLGWSSWMAPKSAGRDLDDVIIGASERSKAA